MLISGYEQTNLVTAAHQGILERPIWSSFLRLLRQQSAADTAMLIIRRRVSGEISVIQSNPHPSAATSAEGQYEEHSLEDFHPADPVPFPTMRAERVYAMQEFMPALGNSLPQIPDLAIIPPSMPHARMIRLHETSGYQAWLITARQRGDFAGADSARLSSIAPHFSIALRTLAAIERERLQMQINNPAIENLNFGWMALDANGYIVDLDRQAEELLSNIAAINRSAQGKLHPVSRDAQAQLAKMLNDTELGKIPVATSIHLSDEPWLDMLVKPPKQDAKFENSSTTLIAYIHGDRQPRQERVDQISTLFGLTPQEARLALALSRGRSIAQSADDQNISVHTARLYSKRIYAKTGTKGQTDLVRLILSSIMAL